MSMVKQGNNQDRSPRYFLINKSEPRYDLLKSQLLDYSLLPSGASHYFVRAEQESLSLCRIRAGNGTVIFFEILDHEREGITDDDLREACCDKKNASPLPEYYHLSRKINEQLQQYLAIPARHKGTRCTHWTAV